MSIEYNDRHGRSVAAEDWGIATICHNVMHCLAVDNGGIRLKLSWCGQQQHPVGCLYL
jgi:hypothetical protein